MHLNHLAHEKSPYLLQHAHHPVNWYPWNEEVFQIARAEDKPLFVSIGYSTCHWCHVMARESFENQEVASILNQYFLAIKVDREERPDIDSIYMSACLALTGVGGWPLSVFINDNKEPFYVGTYYPKDVFINLLKQIAKIWKENRHILYQNKDILTEYLFSKPKAAHKLDERIIDTTYFRLLDRFDEKYGGFSRAPKFSTPQNLLFLLKYFQITKKEKALKMVITTLDAMRAGGLYDHIGFGFCRYATDKKWLIPHFEKMLYDNALLLITYLEAYAVTKLERFKIVSEEIITFLLTEMQSPEGGFYTAIDADSEGEEGKYYLFTYEELVNLLDDVSFLNITKEGHYEGKNIINTIGGNYPLPEKIRLKILNYRNQRTKPDIDDKILTSFNGLIIAGFALAGRLIDNKYLDIARNGYHFINNNLYFKGRLLARYRDGEAKIMAFAEDYAFLIYGMIELYLSTLDDEYLQFALSLNDTFVHHYYDFSEGGFFMTAADAETILFRQKEIADGATPSGNSIQINNLLRLASLTENEDLKYKALQSIDCFGKEINDFPLGYTYTILNLLLEKNIVSIKLSGNNIKQMQKVIYEANPPFYIIKKVANGYQNKALICKEGRCLPEIDNLETLRHTLETS